MGVDPRVFWRMTPAETEIFGRGLRERERNEWRRLSWLAAQIINISGKSVRTEIRPEQLVSFAEEDKPIDIEKRRAEAIEGLAEAKKKFWTLIKDQKLDDMKDIKDN